jgi:hypothetical protein
MARQPHECPTGLDFACLDFEGAPLRACGTGSQCPPVMDDN